MKVGSRAPEPDSQSRWKTIAWLIGPLAVVGIVAFILFRPPVAPSPTASSSASPSIAARVTPTPFPTPDWEAVDAASLEIRAVPFDQGSTVGSFALAGERVIAAGSVDQGPAAWYSDDAGETWTNSSVEAIGVASPGTSTRLEAVAARGAKLVALGKHYQLPQGLPVGTSIWTSMDAGAHWSEQPQEDEAGNIGSFEIGNQLTAGDIGFVIEQIGARAGMLISADAETWEAMEGVTSRGNAQFTGVAAHGDTLLVTGIRQGNTRGDVTPMVWTYTDAQGWSTGSADGLIGPAIIGGPFADASGFYASGLVLRHPGSIKDPQAAMWQSMDGRTWQQRILTPTLDSEAGRLTHGALGTLVTGDTLAAEDRDTTGDSVKPSSFIWFLPNGSPPDQSVQEYPLKRLGRAAIGLGDRFLVFGVCDQDDSDCEGPAMLIFTGSDEPYASAVPDGT